MTEKEKIELETLLFIEEASTLPTFIPTVYDHATGQDVLSKDSGPLRKGWTKQQAEEYFATIGQKKCVRFYFVDGSKKPINTENYGIDT